VNENEDMIYIAARGTFELIMRAGTFSCNRCKIKFQLIGISTVKNPRYCAYCGNDSIERNNIIFG
jgi:hypothetical protein